jgi:hypothetical protein
MAEKDKKAFTGGVDKAQAEFNKALAGAKSVLADAKKQGNKEVATVARGLINQLNTVAKPALDILQKSQNPNAAYTGNVTPINQALAGGAPGSGPSGLVLGTGGTGAYSLGQIRSYMDANNGSFPPDLNVNASGITATDLGNLQNQYNTGKGLDGSNAITGTGLKTDAEIAAETLAGQKREERQSAYDLLYSQFNAYGLGSLVTPLQNLIISGASPSEFTIRLRETEAYKKRFAANAKRIANGLAALDEADYIGLEDQYQKIMRNYGLPPSYYTKGDLGVQEGFEKFIANDVSAAELEDRVMTAQQRVINANPEVLKSIKDFYGDSITDGNILAYVLDPTKGLEDIKRKVTAAEIGGAAVQAGLNLGDTPEQRAIYAARAAELGAAGITKAQAQQGFQTVAEVAPRGGQLAAIYGESPYTQQTAEQEVFGLAGSTEAAKQRKKLVSLEQAAFAGQSGAAQGAFARERAGNL